MWSPNSVAGLALAVGASASMLAAVWCSVGGRRRLASSVTAAALTFQGVHVAEHGLQLTAWLFGTRNTAWLSPWAESTANGVGYWCSLVLSDVKPSALGNESLHLLGNAIFFAGLVAMATLPVYRSSKELILARWIQGFHLAEHVALTTSLALFGRPYGLSTGFGVLDGAELVGARVLFHFAINAAATAFAAMAVQRARRARPRPRRSPLVAPDVFEKAPTVSR